MVPFFPFQREAIDAVFADWTAGLRALPISLPTGAGKTLVGTEVARRKYARTGQPVLVLVPSDEILRQTVEEIGLAWEGVQIGVVQQERREFDRPVVVASVATLVRHLDCLPRVGLVITDEAHHAEAAMWQEIYHAVGQRNPGYWYLGLTATPFRSGSKGEARPLTAVFEKLSYARSMFDLIVEGFLVHLRGVCISTGATLDRVGVRGEDFEEQVLARVVNTPARNALVVHSYLQHCAGKRALCFAVNVPHAEALAAAFQQASVAAAVLTGDTSLDTRRALLTQLRDGTMQVVVTCGVLRKGFNEPSVEAVICARPTRSRVLYIQQVGRVSRRWPGKSEGIILDLVDNTRTHSPVSLGELLRFYGLRRAEVDLAATGVSVPFPSAVGLADAQHFRLEFNGRPSVVTRGGTVQFDGASYLYGEPALRYARTVVHPRDRRWIESRPYRILWHAVLESLVVPGMVPRIVTGLPVSFYPDRERLHNVVCALLRDRGISDAQVTVVPQPFGSFFDSVFDLHGHVQDEAQALAHVGIVDVGYFTTDLVEVNDLEFVQKGSGSIEVGVATVLDTLRRVIAEELARPLDAQEAEQVLRDRCLKVKEHMHDLGGLCDLAVREAATAVAAYVRQLWSGAEGLDRLLLTGGGGMVFQPFLQAEFPELMLAPAPVLANARGFLQYALYCERHVA